MTESMSSMATGGMNGGNEAIFKAFDSYPWAEDPRFAALVRTVASRGMAATTPSVILAMRIAWAKSALKLNIDKSAYAAWLSQTDPSYSVSGGLDKQLADTLGEMMAAEARSGIQGNPTTTAAMTTVEEGTVVLDWQKAAPREEGIVEKGEGEGQPPAKLAELLRFLQEGVPVPGVREIPSTVVRDVNVKPFGSRAAPRKPWERGETGVQEGTGSSVIGEEFSPVHGED